MVNCSILGCKNNHNRRQENIAYHRFPKEPTLRRRWVKATGRFDWQPPKQARICSKHFETKLLRRTEKGTFLKAGAFPKFFIQNNGLENSINLPEAIPTNSQITHCLKTCNCICHNNKMVVNKVTVSTGTQTIPIYDLSEKNNESTTRSESKESQGGKEEDEMDEGQEEWLSEGILTDDDYNPAGDQSKADSNLNTSQDTAPSLHEADVNEDSKHVMNIEETLDNFQNSNQTELPEELGAFLIRKTDGRVIDSKREESEIDESTKQSDDDGHDTDELLRMLGGEDSSKKDSVKKSDQKRTHESQSSDDDDDEYIFEGAKVARLKVAKNAILKKYPSKAVPEETSDRDTDMSSDEGLTVKRMFGVTRKTNVAAKSTAKSSINALKTVTKKVVSLQKPSDKKPVTSTPIPKPVTQTKVVRAEPEEIIDEEEFLEEDQFDLDEELDAELQQRIMRPEQMDEEVPSDADSHEDNDSLYDELPSSDSDDLNDWFTLDIRSERAGDYIPLLGSKAHQLLQAEKQRVSSRLKTLKQSVSALNKSSAQQAEMLRLATLQLAELDAALKA